MKNGTFPNNKTKMGSIKDNPYWACYFGEFAIPYITTPLLVHQETEDFVQLWANGDIAPPWNTQKEVYLNEWRVNTTLTVIITL